MGQLEINHHMLYHKIQCLLFTSGIVTIEMEVDDPEVEVAHNAPLTLRCRVKTNARIYLLFFAKNEEYHAMHYSRDGYLTITKTEENGVHVVEAHYDAFRETDVKQFLCILKADAFDIVKYISVRGK